MEFPSINRIVSKDWRSKKKRKGKKTKKQKDKKKLEKGRGKKKESKDDERKVRRTERRLTICHVVCVLPRQLLDPRSNRPTT